MTRPRPLHRLRRFFTLCARARRVYVIRRARLFAAFLGHGYTPAEALHVASLELKARTVRQRFAVMRVTVRLMARLEPEADYSYVLKQLAFEEIRALEEVIG